MTNMTGKEALEELVAGLDGVTPGKWRRDAKDGDVMAGDGEDAVVVAVTEIGTAHYDKDWEADAAHIARCSPDRIRAIATDFATLEAEVKKLHASIDAWCEQYDRANSEKSALEARAIAAEERVKELEAQLKKETHRANDGEYFKLAYRNMLGPVGLQVVKMWETKGVTRVHFDWGPDAHKLTGEERAKVILEVEDSINEERAALAGDKP